MMGSSILLVEDNPDDQALTQDTADKRTQIVPVVVLTSSKQQEDILGSYHSGASAYVRKPVNFIGLSAAVSTVGMSWLLLNEAAPEFILPSD
jgi:two-component system response regulator